MDFDHLKEQWKDVKIDTKNSVLNEEELSRITSKNYRSNFIKLILPELLFSILYIFGVIFFIVFFKVFQTRLHTFLALIAVFLLCLISALNLFSFFQYYKVSNLISPLDQTLSLLKIKGQRFIQMQHLLIILKVVLFCICVILVPLVYNENPSSTSIVITSLIGGILIALFSMRLWKYYKTKINDIESLLRNLD